jgi:hypothetical protein
MSEPYRDTSVPVERSKQQIRDALKRAGERLVPMIESGKLALPARGETV